MTRVIETCYQNERVIDRIVRLSPHSVAEHRAHAEKYFDTVVPMGVNGFRAFQRETETIRIVKEVEA